MDILAHLDVVPAGDDWTVTKPFEPKMVDGRLYGRGSADDKGPAMAGLWAAKAVKDLKIPLSKNCRVILGTDEESGSSDIAYYYQKEEEAPLPFLRMHLFQLSMWKREVTVVILPLGGQKRKNYLGFCLSKAVFAGMSFG